jgi:tetratricopeptide (TPR) repeat protein
VLGQRFDRGALAHLLDEPDFDSKRLLASRMVHTLGEEFLFAHALIHEAVYDSLLKSHRRELHRRAAEWFAHRDATLKASHLERAGDPAAPAAYLEAAQSQRREYRFDVGRKLAERGLELASDRKDRFALQHLIGELLHELGDMPGALAAFENALTVASDEAERCRAWIGCAQVKRVIDDIEGAFADLARAEGVVVAFGLAAEEAQLRFLRGNLYFPRGDIEGCLREHGKSLELARCARDVNLEAAALGGLGDAEYARGRMASAHARLRACVDLCRQHDFSRLAVANHAQVAHTMLYLSPQEDALKEALAAAEAASKVGHLRAELNARLAAMFALTVLARFEACRNMANEVESLVQRLGARRFDQARLLHLGHVALAEGRQAEAVELLQRALAVARATTLTFHGPWILGVLALAAGDPDASRRALAEGEAIIATGCVGHNQLRFYPAATQLALEVGATGCGRRSPWR